MQRQHYGASPRSTLNVSDRKRISWNDAHAVAQYCRAHNVEYANESNYPNTFQAGAKKNLRTHNGMMYHRPRTAVSPWSREEHQRLYLCWYGEPIEEVIAALAELTMTSKRQLWLLRCKTKRKVPKDAVLTEVADG